MVYTCVMSDTHDTYEEEEAAVRSVHSGMSKVDLASRLRDRRCHRDELVCRAAACLCSDSSGVRQR